MEVFVGCKVKPSQSESTKRCSKMIEWETISKDEYSSYRDYLVNELRKKCKDEAISRLIRCFGHPKGLRFYWQREILNQGNHLERNLYLLMLFLDNRGLKAQGPLVPEDISRIRKVLVKSVQMRMKNLMPNRCGGCRMWYAVPHGVLPEVVCGRCGRARHDCIPFVKDRDTDRCIWFCTDCGIDCTADIRKEHRVKKAAYDVDSDDERPLANVNWSIGNSCTVEPAIDSDISSDEDIDILSGEALDISDEEFDRPISDDEGHSMDWADADTSAASDYESDSCDIFQINFENTREAKAKSNAVERVNRFNRVFEKLEKQNQSNGRENQDCQGCEKDSVVRNSNQFLNQNDCASITAEEVIKAMEKINLEKVWCGRKNLTWCVALKCTDPLTVPVQSFNMSLRKGTVPDNCFTSWVMLLFKDI